MFKPPYTCEKFLDKLLSGIPNPFLRIKAQIIPEVNLERITQLKLKVLSTLPASSPLIHQKAERKCAVITQLNKEEYGA